MFMNEQSLAKIYQLDHQYEEAEKMRENARLRELSIQNILYDVKERIL